MLGGGGIELGMQAVAGSSDPGLVVGRELDWSRRRRVIIRRVY